MPETAIAWPKTLLCEGQKTLAPGAPRSLERLRAAGAEQFAGLPCPNKGQEEFRHTDLSSIVETPFQSLARPEVPAQEALSAWLYPDTAWAQLVFVNGFFCAALSTRGALPDAIQAGGLAEGWKGPHAAVLETHLGSCLGERNAFTALNSALVHDGAFVYVPKNVVSPVPIHCLFLSVPQGAPVAANPRNLFAIGESGEVSIVCTYASLAEGTPVLTNLVEETVLSANAHLDYCKMVKESASGRHFSTHEVRQERDSRQSAFFATLSGGFVRNQAYTRLADEGTRCHIAGLYLCDGSRVVDNYLHIAHEQPHGESRIFFKGILEDESRAVFLGKVHVFPGAQHTDSEQLNNNLLLSERARVNTKPQLEIYADDVKCTHGATVGPPPEESIFYLRSRGINEVTARGMLTRGFAEEALLSLPVIEARGRVARHILDKYQVKR